MYVQNAETMAQDGQPHEWGNIVAIRALDKCREKNGERFVYNQCWELIKISNNKYRFLNFLKLNKSI